VFAAPELSPPEPAAAAGGSFGPIVSSCRGSFWPVRGFDAA